MFRIANRYSSSIATKYETVFKHYNEIPGPKSYPLLGSVPNYIPGIGKYASKDVLQSGIMKFHEFGPIIKESFVGHEAVFLFDPSHIERLFRSTGVTRRSHLTLGHIRANSEDHVNGGILFENGPAWYKLRSGSQQSLTMESFKEHIPKVEQLTDRMLHNLENDPITLEVINKDFLLALFALNCDIMGSMLFGLDWNSTNDILDESALTTRIIHSSSYLNRMIAPMDNGLMLWKLFQTPMYKKLKKCSDDVDFIPKREVEKRLRQKMPVFGSSILDRWMQEGHFDNKTMITVLSDLLLAGIDTTSYTLAFTMYNLSVNERVQNTLYAEIMELTTMYKSVSEQIADSKYLKQVVKESMRLFPVSVGTSRILDESCVIGGYKMPKNITVITMNQIASRLDEYVERANEFIPERFDSKSGFQKIRPFTMLPFGHGARACVGRRVAEMTMYIFLLKLIQNFQIEWVGNKPLGCIALSITEPDGPLHFKFSSRNPLPKK